MNSLQGVAGPDDAEDVGLGIFDDPTTPTGVPNAYTDAFAEAAFAAFTEPGVRVLAKADMPEHVDGRWRCGRCKAPMAGTGRCLDCWPATPDDPTPTTGAPPDPDDWPEGCRCHYREDADWGDVRVSPPGGCPVHSCTCLSIIDGVHTDTCLITVLSTPPPPPAVVTAEGDVLPANPGPAALIWLVP